MTLLADIETTEDTKTVGPAFEEVPLDAQTLFRVEGTLAVDVIIVPISGEGAKVKIGLAQGSNMLCAQDTINVGNFAQASAVWTHVAIVYYKSMSSAQLLVNGRLVVTMPGVSAGMLTSIGRPGATGEYYAGALDELRIWKVPRDASVIQQNMHRRSNACDSTMNAYWRLDEAIGSTCYDMTGELRQFASRIVA